MQNELCIVADAIKALREARGLTVRPAKGI